MPIPSEETALGREQESASIRARGYLWKPSFFILADLLRNYRGLVLVFHIEDTGDRPATPESRSLLMKHRELIFISVAFGARGNQLWIRWPSQRSSASLRASTFPFHPDPKAGDDSAALSGGYEKASRGP